MPDSSASDRTAEKIDRLLYSCAGAAVFIGVLQLAEHHYLRAVLAAVFFLIIAPWLGRKLINRAG